MSFLFPRAVFILCRKLIYIYMRLEFYREWVFSKQPPEFFKHEIDLYSWYRTRSSMWLERGVYARQNMFKGCKVLDLCCGDGSYSFLFFSNIAGEIMAVDYEDDAIRHAKKNYSAPNIRFEKVNILTDEIPGNGYHVIVWNAAIEHFSLANIESVFNKLKKQSVQEAFVAGYTNKRTETLAHPEHEYEFETKAELAQFISKWLNDVQVIETWHPERENFYFSGRFKSE